MSIVGTFSQAATLTVAKAGQIGGTVTGTGINCGADCSETVAGGPIVLTATPTQGATFGSWTGCDIVAAASCTVNMTSDRRVTATFSFEPTAPVTTVASTSSSGVYAVTAACIPNNCGNTIIVQEALTQAFTNPVQTSYTPVQQATVISMSNKIAGTYCYRAALIAPAWGNTSCVTVNPPNVAVLRVSNTSSYDLIDVRLNGTQRVEYPFAISPGQFADFIMPTTGPVPVVLGNGYYKADQSRELGFTLTGTENVTVGQTTTLTFANPSVGELVTGLTATRTFDGQYFNGSTLASHKQYRFTKATSDWQLYDTTAPCGSGISCTFAQVSSGTVQMTNWPRYAPSVSLQLSIGQPAVDFAFPFSTFVVPNGPVSWPKIQYVRQ
jgi:hypothetical protein